MAVLQAPPKPPVTEPHVTVTALAGTVEQAPKAAGELTLSVQFPRNKPVVVHVTTALAEPFTTGVPEGSEARNVMAAGATDAVDIAVAFGFGFATIAADCAGAGTPDTDAIPSNSPGSNNDSICLVRIPYVALMVNVAVAVYVPVL